ncbi:MAG: DUF2147 domain-containing protein [Janthinobacterium lividum]
MRIGGVLAALMPALIAGSASAAPAPIAGRWLTMEGKAIVDVEPCRQDAGQLCGRIARVLKPRPGEPAVDQKNPDPALRSRPIQGIAVLESFTAAGDRWKGRIYDPESGREYRSEVTRRGGTLHVKGCVGPFCRTQDWMRAG